VPDVALLFFTKLDDDAEARTASANLHGFLGGLDSPELVRSVLFVDDSPAETRAILAATLERAVVEYLPQAELKTVHDTGSPYASVNAAWALVREELALVFHSDYSLVARLDLASVAAVFAAEPALYQVHLGVRGLFGFNDDTRSGLRDAYPWYRDYRGDEVETWYHRDSRGRPVTLPEGLLAARAHGLLPAEQDGTTLVPRRVDEKTTLWTPRAPASLLAGRPIHERFVGAPVVHRVADVQRQLPLPPSLRAADAATCHEAYFLATGFDERRLIGYLNLQAFAVQTSDPRRPLWNYTELEAFAARNSVPVHAESGSRLRDFAPWYLRRALLVPQWRSIERWLRSRMRR
jgi:hypothetical protein